MRADHSSLARQQLSRRENIPKAPYAGCQPAEREKAMRMSCSGLRATFLGMLLLLSLGLLAPAHAQQRRMALPPLENDPKLGPMFSRAVEALVAQRYDEALPAFEDLYKQSPRPVLLYYLGKVAQGQQRLGMAFDLYRRFLRGAGDEIDADTRYEVGQFISSTAQPECEVSAAGEPGALLTVDGRVVGMLPLDYAMAIPPGSHRLQLEKGRRKAVTQVSLVANRRVQVRFNLAQSLAVLTVTPGVLFLPEVVPPDQLAGLLSPLQTAIKTSLLSQNAVLIGPDAQGDLRAHNPELVGCLDQFGCQERFGQLAAAQFVLRLVIQGTIAGPAPTAPTAIAPAHSYRYQISLIDVDVGQVSVEALQTCTDCPAPRLVAQVNDAIADLFRQASTRARGTLVINSEPPGAVVQVDGRTLGNTPFRRDTFVGAHDISVSKPGYLTQQQVVQIGDGDSRTWQVSLPSANASAPAPGIPAKRIAKWALLGTGLVATIAGGVLLGLDGRVTCAGTGTDCTVFQGKPVGIPLLVVGIGSLAASGALFALDRDPAPASVPRSQPAPSAPAAAVALTF